MESVKMRPGPIFRGQGRVQTDHSTVTRPDTGGKGGDLGNIICKTIGFTLDSRQRLAWVLCLIALDIVIL